MGKLAWVLMLLAALIVFFALEGGLINSVLGTISNGLNSMAMPVFHVSGQQEIIKQ